MGEGEREALDVLDMEGHTYIAYGIYYSHTIQRDGHCGLGAHGPGMMGSLYERYRERLR